jgi:hypothetical protein
MQLSAMIGELRQELRRIDEAILALERLSAGQAKRRGRPPRWLKELEAEVNAETGRGEESTSEVEPPKVKAKGA